MLKQGCSVAVRNVLLEVNRLRRTRAGTAVWFTRLCDECSVLVVGEGGGEPGVFG